MQWGGGAGAVALRGLSAGRASRVVAAAELLAAAAEADLDAKPIYVDVDAEGYLVPAGARGGEGAAALIARARLAPDAVSAARAARLEAAQGGLRLRLRAPAAPHADLLLWPDAHLQEAAQLPHLTPHHKLGADEYWCERCGRRFAAPHLLRVHLFLSCGAATARRFYSALLRRLAPSAFRPYTSVTAAGGAAAAGAGAPAALEALATAWGRRAGGGAGHACVYCGRLYSRRYGLKIHLRTHTGYKPLRCPHCRRAFGDPSNLNKHVKLHGARAGGAGGAAGGGGHACATCGKQLARRRDLERHVRARHAPAAPAPATSDRRPPPPRRLTVTATAHY